MGRIDPFPVRLGAAELRIHDAHNPCKGHSLGHVGHVSAEEPGCPGIGHNGTGNREKRDRRCARLLDQLDPLQRGSQGFGDDARGCARREKLPIRDVGRREVGDKVVPQRDRERRVKMGGQAFQRELVQLGKEGDKLVKLDQRVAADVDARHHGVHRVLVGIKPQALQRSLEL